MKPVARPPVSLPIEFFEIPDRASGGASSESATGGGAQLPIHSPFPVGRSISALQQLDGRNTDRR